MSKDSLWLDASIPESLDLDSEGRVVRWRDRRSLRVRLRRARSWLLCRLGLHKWVRGRYVSTRVCQRCYREEALCRGAGSDDWIETRGK